MSLGRAERLFYFAPRYHACRIPASVGPAGVARQEIVLIIFSPRSVSGDEQNHRIVWLDVRQIGQGGAHIGGRRRQASCGRYGRQALAC